MLSIKNLLLSCFLVLMLAACESAEEKAEEYYQSGLALMEEGDFDRAIVEFRNVFELNSAHQEARRKMAEILLLHKDNTRGAYRQYLRLAEQYPDDLDARINLSELAFITGNWEEMERHGTKALELDPQNMRVEAIGVSLGYRQSVIDEDNTARREQTDAATNLLPELPDNKMLRAIITDSYVRDRELTKALASLDWFFENDPDNILHWRQRLSLLAELGEMEELEVRLKEMVDRFPENLETKQTLLRFYMTRNQIDDAEAFLRALVARNDSEDARTDLVNFLIQVRGTEAARAELTQAIAEEENPYRYQILRAGLDFSEGEREAAVSELETILEIPELDNRTRQATQIALAQMLIEMGNDVGARKYVEALLADDPTNPEGLKMQARWQIESDDPESAINGLRTALDRSPEDSQAMSLMAQAYQRAGNPELAREFLSLAVEASGNAPQETLRYANLLIGDENYLAAEDLLKSALRLAPRNPDLLNAIGLLYLRMDDLGRAEQVVRTLESLNTPQTRRMAQQIEAERLNRQGGSDQALSYLSQLAQSEDADVATRINLIRAQLSTGEREAALAGAQELVAADPQNANLRALLGLVQQANGNLEEAETIYRALLAEDPARPAVWVRLARLVRISEGLEAASAVIEEGLTVTPDAANMLFESATLKEYSGDIDGAIEIYEALYARNSNSAVVANNLASLIATYRSDDPASVERAWTVARRLQNARFPAMQDTYGWILHLRGAHEEALPYLEAAAEGLPNDPIVQFHLAQIYSALERPEEALAQYRKAVDVAGPADQRDQIESARARIAELQTLPETATPQTQEN